MEFVSIDVETANPDMASICQIGIACFNNGQLEREWSSLVNPRDYFDPINVSVHGINETSVSSAPSFEEIYHEIRSLLSGKICVSHTHFDRISMDKAIRKHSLDPIDVVWLDSARIARRAWEECAWKGYGLANVCKIIGFEFKHHDALEDAKACGAIVHAAVEKAGLTLEGWLTRVGQPISGLSSSGGKVALEGNPEGELYGQSVVFTGALSIPRKDAAAMAASIGCSVAPTVSKKIDYLVVGDQDASRLAGKDKSSKHIKAEKLIASGVQIRILKESDFKELVDGAARNA
ncbi:predicted type III DNA polymerase PolC (plasmid) [Desulforapulum autotrophicum HRM2]|jgi:DNA polymerase-3 subunit epsilon|uniref:Predicted type III DNA polymerase PolC n=1 Tax=Desulforapulum autotrophicum (strain ATCC 43914 / DSM 3382 / VKM B-1955 / HRM2) TaxID=177437 RepID=C0QMS3_DESAH|nr:exonuclease domain-containing protein [Desulforapulum autotrophicum]ACN18067.1 predicted type III DNA polymerase PolC [Desulforapulum autotrophicum HRM2]